MSWCVVILRSHILRSSSPSDWEWETVLGHSGWFGWFLSFPTAALYSSCPSTPSSHFSLPNPCMDVCPLVSPSFQLPTHCSAASLHFSPFGVSPCGRSFTVSPRAWEAGKAWLVEQKTKQVYHLLLMPPHLLLLSIILADHLFPSN